MLANDDVLLVFFTKDLGTVSVFASKLARSKKKILEVDFFRLIELELRSQKEHFKLGSCRTLRVFAAFGNNFKTMESGFEVLEKVHTFFAEQKCDTVFFELLIQGLSVAEIEEVFCFLRVKCLVYGGFLPRFDVLRGDVYLNPETLDFSVEAHPHYIFIENHHRQILEWVRRVHLPEFLEKMDKFNKSDWFAIDNYLKTIEKHH